MNEKILLQWLSVTQMLLLWLSFGMEKGQTILRIFTLTLAGTLPWLQKGFNRI